MYSIFEAKHNAIYQNNGSEAGGKEILLRRQFETRGTNNVLTLSYLKESSTPMFTLNTKVSKTRLMLQSISMPVQKGIDFATKLSIDLSLWQTSIRVLGHSLLIEISTAGPRAPWHADLSSRHQESKFEQKTVKPVRPRI